MLQECVPLLKPHMGGSIQECKAAVPGGASPALPQEPEALPCLLTAPRNTSISHPQAKFSFHVKPQDEATQRPEQEQVEHQTKTHAETSPYQPTN